MRLSCPNCTVEYEIAAELVPKGGRNMQCSGCSHVWMHYPPLILTNPLVGGQESPKAVTKGDKKPKSPKAQEVKKPKKPEPKKPEPKKTQTTKAQSVESAPSVTGGVEQPLSSAKIVEILRDEAQYAKSVRQSQVAPPQKPKAPQKPEKPKTPPPSQKPPQKPKTPLKATPKSPILRTTAIKTTAPVHFIMPTESQPASKNTASKNNEKTQFVDPLTTPLQTSPYGTNEPPPAPNDQRIFLAGFQVGLCVVLLMASLYTFDTQITAFLPSTTPILADYTAFIEQTYQQGYDFYLSSVKPSLIEFFGQEFFNQFRLLHRF